MAQSSVPYLRLLEPDARAANPDLSLVPDTIHHVVETFDDYSLLCEKGQPPVRLFLTSRARSVSILRADPAVAPKLAMLEAKAVSSKCRLTYGWDGHELFGELSAH